MRIGSDIRMDFPHSFGIGYRDPFNKYLKSTYEMPCLVRGTRNPQRLESRKQTKIPAQIGDCILVGRDR